MAKEKSVLSIEEKLQKALVSESEQPYKVPSNWCWTRLGEVCSPSNIKTDFFSEGKNYVGLENIEKDKGITSFSTTENLKSTKNVFSKGQILYGKLRPYLNKHDIATFDGITSTDVLVLNPKKNISPILINKYFDLDNFIQYAVSNSKGINLPRVSASDLLMYPFPLPPLAEQERIVERIESMFSKLDEAKSIVLSALDTFENRKAAILHKAFTGELTANWRKEHGVRLEDWEEKTLGQVLDVRDGTHDSPIFQETGYPLITSKNLKNGQLNYAGVKFVTEQDYNFINQRSKVDIGDILFAMIGTIGNPVVVSNEPDYAIKNVALLKDIGEINPYFVKCYLESQFVRHKMQKEAKGSTQKFVSLGYLRAFPIKLPSLAEQKEIVRILDSILEKEEKAKELCSVIEHLDIMKKAILAKAFRGELGTNRPDEESSVELLRELVGE